MGRELVMVPPNYEHPKYSEEEADIGRKRGTYKPLHDRSYGDALAEYAEKVIELGVEGAEDEYGPPPVAEDFADLGPEAERTWFQVWETVSEGTPVSPPFATREELVEYLVRHGDFWDQARRLRHPSAPGNGPWSRASAEAFVMGDGFAPSMVMNHGAVMTGVEFLGTKNK